MTRVSDVLQRVLLVVGDAVEPLSGRRVGDLAGMSSTTANKALAELEDLGVVRGQRRGRAVLWEADAAAASLLTAVRPAGQLEVRTVVVLTALPLEYLAVKKRLSSPEERRARNTTRYLDGHFSGERVVWRVLLAQTGMGNASVAALVGQAVDEYNADLIAFVGIGAGIKPADQQLGDVVIIERAYNAHSGKHTVDADGNAIFQTRPTSYPTSISLLNLGRSVARHGDWDPATARRAGKPKVTVSAVASTEAVVNNPASELYVQIARGLNDCSLIDMETFGLYAGAHTSQVPAIAVRGISDYASGKTAVADKTRQPSAARNATDVFMEILFRADPDDVPPRRFGPRATSPERTAPESAPGLPPWAQPWESRLRAVSPARADAAVADLTDPATQAALPTWVSRTLHRPKPWLRDDPTGDGWALVAAFAEAADAGGTSAAFERAASAAAANSDVAVAVAHRMRAAVASGAGGSNAEQVERIAQALRSVDLGDAPELAPLNEFYLATTQTTFQLILDAAVPALRSLGIDPADLGLDTERDLEPDREPSDGETDLPGDDAVTGDAPTAARTAATTLVPLPEQVRIYLATGVLLTVAWVLLADEDGDRAHRAAQRALTLTPDSATGRLRLAQAMLTQLHSDVPSAMIADASDLLRRVEEVAMEVRQMQSQWGRPTAEALALAGRARIEGGDAASALTLLRAAPNGQANQHEAASEEVRQVTALAALLTGETELALELAQTLTSAEAHLTRGAALARAAGMRGEAVTAYRMALDASQGRLDYLERALLGLARLGVPVEGDSPDALTEHVARLRAQDLQGADLVIATAELTTGNYERAVMIARRYRTVLRAVELEVDALAAAGDRDKAVERLDAFGRGRGDNALRVQAMMLAGQFAMWDRVSAIATDVIDAETGELRRVAREAKMYAASRVGDWRGAELQVGKLLAELATAASTSGQENAGRDADDGERAIAYRWLGTEALYRQRRFSEALDMLTTPGLLPTTERTQVMLVLAVVRSLYGQGAAGQSGQPAVKVPDDVFDWVLTIAAAWAADEEISAEAIKVILTAPVDLNDKRLVRARELQERYFDQFADDGQIKRISVADGEMTELVELLRATFAPQAEGMTGLVTKVVVGDFPAAVLADASHRSYAQLLIEPALRVYIVRSEPDARQSGRVAAARAALDAGQVTVDTSALVVASKLGRPRTTFTALFGKVFLPVSLRDDIYRARASLSLRTTSTLGWDPTSQRPTLTTFDDDMVTAWATDADALAGDLAHLVVAADAQDSDRALWSAAVRLAGHLGTALWADDVALRDWARAEGVAAFSTLDLIDAARDRELDDAPSPEDIRCALVAARIVDLPLTVPWSSAARAENFDPGAYTALSISRRAAWRDVPASFLQYQQLMRQLPSGDVDRLTTWAALAVNGLAWAVPPPARARVVGALLAWTALNLEPLLAAERLIDPGMPVEAAAAGEVFRALLDVADTIGMTAFPGGDGIAETITIISQTLRSVSDGVTMSKLLARAISTLDQPHRSRAMTALLSSPASPPAPPNQAPSKR